MRMATDPEDEISVGTAAKISLFAHHALRRQRKHEGAVKKPFVGDKESEATKSGKYLSG